MNSKCGPCSFSHQGENDGLKSSENEESLDDSNDDVEKKTVTFYRWGKPERTKKINITTDEDEAWETCCKVIKDPNMHIYQKRKQVNILIV